jgi:hypothetical protein
MKTIRIIAISFFTTFLCFFVWGCGSSASTPDAGDAGILEDGDAGIQEDGGQLEEDDPQEENPPNPIETFSFSYDAGGYERLKGLITTSDGNFVFIGDSNSFETGNYGAWIVKLNQQGAIIWSRILDGSRWEEFVKVVELNDGSLLAAGYSDSSSAQKDQILVVKFSASGEVLWQKLYGDPSGTTSYQTTELLVTPDAGFLIIGTQRTFANSSPLQYDDFDLYLLKLDADGEIIWQKTYGDLCWQLGHTAINLTQGGYLVAASTRGGFTGSWIRECWLGNPGQHNPYIWLIEINENGEMGQNQILGAANGMFPRYLTTTADNGYYLTATAYWTDYNFDGNFFKDMAAFTLDSQKEVVWSVVFGDYNSDHDVYTGLLASDNSYYLAGLVDANYDGNSPGHSAGFIAKLSPEGSLLWQRRYQHADYDEIRTLIEFVDGALLVGGKIQAYTPETIYQPWIMSLDPQGMGCDASQDNPTDLPFDNFPISHYYPEGHEEENASAIANTADFAVIDSSQGLDFNDWCE